MSYEIWAYLEQIGVDFVAMSCLASQDVSEPESADRHENSEDFIELKGEG